MQIWKEVRTVSVRYVEYDGIKFYADKKGYWLGTVNKRAKRLHIYVWEKHNGKVPKGYHVHHVDFNTNNNELSNLQLLSQREHLSLHGKKESNRALARINVQKYAQPKSLEWRKTQACSDWAKKNYETSLKKAHEKAVEKVCECCGKEYTAEICKRTIARFCSNACKSKWRRDNHIDDVEHFCVVCGKTHITTKYKGRQTCSPECRKTLYMLSREVNALG